MRSAEYQERAEIPKTIMEKLISIDGPDGVGKDKLAEHLSKKMENLNEGAVVITPNLFTCSSRSQKIGEKFVSLGGYSMKPERINKFYLAAFNRNTVDVVIPLLEKGFWVIQASSELRPVAFTVAERSVDVATSTQKLIRSGELNRGIFPKHRILLTSDPHSLNRRIKHRGENLSDDPVDIKGCQRRIDSYEHAVGFIKETLRQEENNFYWKTQVIENVESEKIDEYMAKIASDLAEWVLKIK